MLNNIKVIMEHMLKNEIIPKEFFLLLTIKTLIELKDENEIENLAIIFQKYPIIDVWRPFINNFLTKELIGICSKIILYLHIMVYNKIYYV